MFKKNIKNEPKISPIKIKNISILLNDRLILRNINCQINDKSITAILGPNGAGKSLLLQTINGLIPIIVSLSAQAIEEVHLEYKYLFLSLVVPSHKAIKAYLFDARYSILTVMLAGFGRAISEVGAVIIVGGNIDHLTRVMTTSIALETSKGNLSLALALGIILLSIALTVNFLLIRLKIRAKRRMYV